MLMRKSTRREKVIVQKREERIAGGDGKKYGNEHTLENLILGVTWQVHLKFQSGQQSVDADDAG